MPPRPIPIKPANMQVARQIVDLGSKRQAELDAFLAVLQVNPYHPDVMNNSAVLPDDRYQYVLSSGSVVTWKIESRHVDGTPHLLPAWDYLLILLLDVEY